MFVERFSDEGKKHFPLPLSVKHCKVSPCALSNGSCYATALQKCLIFIVKNWGVSDALGNVRIKSVNPSHYRSIWADNWLRAALNHGDCQEGRVGL